MITYSLRSRHRANIGCRLERADNSHADLLVWLYAPYYPAPSFWLLLAFRSRLQGIIWCCSGPQQTCMCMSAFILVPSSHDFDHGHIERQSGYRKISKASTKFKISFTLSSILPRSHPWMHTTPEMNRDAHHPWTEWVGTSSDETDWLIAHFLHDITCVEAACGS